MKTAQLEIVPPSETLPSMENAGAIEIWTDLRSQFEKLKSNAEMALTQDPAQPLSAIVARDTRLALRRVRIAVESRRKELGEHHLRKTQEVNAAAGEIRKLIEPYEEKLEAIEKHAERVEADRVLKLSQVRACKLSEVGGSFEGVDLGRMVDEQFDNMLAGATYVYEQNQAKARADEEARIAREKAEAEERLRIRRENERLRKEVQEREALIEQERAEAREEALRQAAVLTEERRKAAEVQRKIEETAQAERVAAQAVARKADIERRRLEAAEAQRVQDEADRKAAEDLARQKAEAAPDKEKLHAFAQSIRAMVEKVPNMTSPTGIQKAEFIASKVEGFANWIENQIKDMA